MRRFIARVARYVVIFAGALAGAAAFTSELVFAQRFEDSQTEASKTESPYFFIESNDPLHPTPDKFRP